MVKKIAFSMIFSVVLASFLFLPSFFTFAQTARQAETESLLKLESLDIKQLLFRNVGEKAGQTQRGFGVKLDNPIRFESLRELVTAIIDIIIQIAVPIAALFLIYSGYLFVSARGNEESLKKAKSIFLWTLVGIAVLLGAEVLSRIIEGTIEQIKR